MLINKKSLLILLGLLTITISSIQIFFEIYRSAAFQTVPRDDYAPYLLYLIGESGSIPGAPFAYRLFSVAIAIPFYYILPPYTFTNLPEVNQTYLQATQALSFSSYLSIVLTAFTMYLVARINYKATCVSSLIISLSTLVFSNLISKVGIDPIAILIITLLILFINKPSLFLPLMLLSIGFNEKIPILFSIVLICRLLSNKICKQSFRFNLQLITAVGSVIGYFIITQVLQVPGNENQTNPSLFFYHLRSSIMYSLSLKGLILNLLPVGVIILMSVLAIQANRRNIFYFSDISGFFLLLGLALIADVVYNIGRVVMYSYPIFLPPIACLIDDLLITNKT